MSYTEYNASKARMPAKPAPVVTRKRDARSEFAANVALAQRFFAARK